MLGELQVSTELRSIQIVYSRILNPVQGLATRTSGHDFGIAKAKPMPPWVLQRFLKPAPPPIKVAPVSMLGILSIHSDSDTTSCIGIPSDPVLPTLRARPEKHEVFEIPLNAVEIPLLG